MKKMLITAVALDGAIASLIIYSRRRNSSTGQIKSAAKDAYKTMNAGIGKVERLGHHAMG